MFDILANKLYNILASSQQYFALFLATQDNIWLHL